MQKIPQINVTFPVNVLQLIDGVDKFSSANIL